jgi:hypothetical protein
MQTAHDSPVLLLMPGGAQRLSLGMRPMHSSMLFTIPLKKAQWRRADGRALEAAAAEKQLKTGLMVLLSSDGAEVDANYLRMFAAQTLILIAPVDDLPVPYVPHVGGVLRTKKIGAN